VFSVNILIKPLDGILTEITNDAIHLLNPNESIPITANVWFSIASVVMLTVVVSVITDKFVEPRLGEYAGETPPASEDTSADESRGLKYATWAIVGVFALFALLTLPPGAPLRNPETGSLIANSPFLNGLIGFIALVFLAAGAAYGVGARTMTSTAEVIAAMEKAVAGLGGLILLLFIISQFLADFAYTNIATIAAVKAGDALERAGWGPLPLLVGFSLVVALITVVLVPIIPKWAICAPIFIPLLMRLGIRPDAVLAAYRVGDAPINALTPLNPYFALVVSFAAKYDKDAGVGTVVALMLPYVVVVLVLWLLLLAAWQLSGLPWGF
jgi:aminobenzoyl-glutamate transport protein